MIDFLPIAILYGMLFGGVYALMSQGLTLCFGVMRVANSAQAAFAILGTFVAFWLLEFIGLDPLLSIPIAAITLFALGVFIYITIVRQTLSGGPLNSFVVTSGFAIVLENLMILFWRNEYRSLKTSYSTASIRLGGIPIPIPLVISFCLSLSIILILSAYLKYSYLGKAIRATSQDNVVAMLVGINVNFIYTVTFGIGVATAGIAGVLIGLRYIFYPALQAEWIGLLYNIVIFGGMGSMAGTLVSSLILGICQSVTTLMLSPTWASVLINLIIIIVLVVRPEGVFGRKR